MIAYWHTLQPRERLILGAGTLLALILLLWALVWEPYVRDGERLAQRVRVEREDLAWMEQAATQVRHLRGSTRLKSRPAGQSLLALVDSTARTHQLGTALKRVQPDGQRAVRVWLEQAQFDTLLVWLERLASDYGVHVSGLVLERGEVAGQVNARVVLDGGAP